MTHSNLPQALAVAGDGLPIFPCHPESKAPLVPTGFHAATIARRQIETWWTEHPDALIGVPTGEASGIDVLDVDPRHGGDVWLRENAATLRGCRVHATRSGGVHVLYRHAEGLRSSAGKVAPGVDVRSSGGYAIWWPSHGCRVAGEATARPWPPELLAAVKAGQTKIQDHCRDPAALAPPSAAAVVDLLTRLPNPLETDRDAYTAVMLAAQGCVQGLEAAGQDADGIAEAAIAWAERWEGYDGTDEAHKWDSDWSTRTAPLAGWHTLERIAGRLIPGYREEQAADDFAAVPLETTDTLLAELDAQTWADLDLPPTKKYLGHLLQTATKLNLIGSTGLGKSQLSHAMATGIASGQGFGPWSCDEPSRVLVVDGEMSTRLVKARIGAAVARHKHPIAPGNLIVYALDREEHFAKKFPGLGRFQPLNKPEGIAFLKRLVQRTAPEVIIFDNVMSLMSGDQKDEITWSGALDLMGWLASLRIAQVWLDHTGHNANRQYGSSTKMWRADAVGVMSPVDKAEVLPGQVRFTLTFAAPQGKARERDGDNHLDFADRTFTMDGSGWTVSGPLKAAVKSAEKEPTDAARAWYGALTAVLQDGKAQCADWWAEAERRGITTQRIHPRDSGTVVNNKMSQLRGYRKALVVAGWIKVDGETVSDMRGEANDDLAALSR